MLGTLPHHISISLNDVGGGASDALDDYCVPAAVSGKCFFLRCVILPSMKPACVAWMMGGGF